MNKKVALIPLAGLMVVGAACSSSPAPAKTSGVIASTSTAPGIPGLEGGAPLVNGEIAPATTTTAAPSVLAYCHQQLGALIAQYPAAHISDGCAESLANGEVKTKSDVDAFVRAAKQLAG